MAALPLSDGGDYFAAISRTNIDLFDLETLKQTKTISVVSTNYLNSVDCNKTDQNLFVTTSSDKFLQIWDARSGRCTKTIATGTKNYSAFFNRSGTQIATMDINNTCVTLWDLATDKPLHTLIGGSALAFNHAGAQLATGGESDGRINLIKIYNPNTGELLRELKNGDINWPQSFAYSPDDSKIVSPGHDARTVLMYDLNTEKDL